MANELLTSYNTAIGRYGHIVFNDRTQQFERAGKCHAIASFFGVAEAKARNAATIDAIKRFVAEEGEREYGVAVTKEIKECFSAIDSTRRVESAAISRIVEKSRDVMAASKNVQRIVKENLLREHLTGWTDMDGVSPEMAERTARYLLSSILSKERIVDCAGLERFRNEAERALTVTMGALASSLPYVDENDLSIFLSVVVDILEHDANANASEESIAAMAHKVSASFIILKDRADRYPGILEDAAGLMKTLHAPIGADCMLRLLGMAERITDDVLNDKKPVEVALDDNLASVCFAGNDISSALEKNEKNWAVAKFILSEAAKIWGEMKESVPAEDGVRRQACGDRVLNAASKMRAFYDRAGGPLCARYSRALGFLTDRYWESGRFGRCCDDAINVGRIPAALLEKYDMIARTKANAEKYRTKISDYSEFDGMGMARMTEMSNLIDGVIGRSRILEGDRVRVRQLVLQELAFSAHSGKGGGIPDDTVRFVTNRYCGMAKWGGALLDRLEKEVPVNCRQAVILAMEAYDCSSDVKLFDMLTKDREIMKSIIVYINECVKRDGRPLLEGISVKAWEIHTILTGDMGLMSDFDPKRNPRLATIYSAA